MDYIEALEKIKEGYNIEIINNVICYHTNKYISFKINNEEISKEIIEYYDVYGNKFYANYSSDKEAIESLKSLEEKGIKAIIGPATPTKFNNKLYPNKQDIGIYIVKEKDKVLRK